MMVSFVSSACSGFKTRVKLRLRTIFVYVSLSFCLIDDALLRGVMTGSVSVGDFCTACDVRMRTAESDIRRVR